MIFMSLQTKLKLIRSRLFRNDTSLLCVGPKITLSFSSDINQLFHLGIIVLQHEDNNTWDLLIVTTQYLIEIHQIDVVQIIR